MWRLGRRAKDRLVHREAVDHAEDEGEALRPRADELRDLGTLRQWQLVALEALRAINRMEESGIRQVLLSTP